MSAPAPMGISGHLVTTSAKPGRRFLVEVQYLKGGKYWTPLFVRVIPASSIVTATGKAARLGKKALPKGTRNPGLMVKVTPAPVVKESGS